MDMNNMNMEQRQLVGQALKGYMQHNKQDKVERFRHLNPFVKKGQIVFAGSSLMEQFPIYEFLLDEDLPYVIYNRGIGGYTTAEMKETLKECIYDLEPKYLFLNIGTNDLNGDDYKEEDLISNYRDILTDVKAHLPEVKIYMLAYYPVNSEVGMSNPMMKHTFECRTNERIHAASEAVKKLAEELGHTFIDVNEGLYDETGNLKKEFTIEGMHMYANGYKVVLDNLKPYLNDLK